MLFFWVYHIRQSFHEQWAMNGGRKALDDSSGGHDLWVESVWSTTTESEHAWRLM